MDTANKLIDDIIAEQVVLESQSNGVDVFQLYNATTNFTFAFTAWTGEEMQLEVAAHLAASLSAEDRARLIFQLLTCSSKEPEVISPADKLFAVHLAEEMGPDWCQWMYHFTVLCTKLS
tara:strand:+ start:5697 stop:6053 length:357 start_codon:yes stop_codon:yes gene_type:complete